MLQYAQAEVRVSLSLSFPSVKFIKWLKSIKPWRPLTVIIQTGRVRTSGQLRWREPKRREYDFICALPWNIHKKRQHLAKDAMMVWVGMSAGNCYASEVACVRDNLRAWHLWVIQVELHQSFIPVLTPAHLLSSIHQHSPLMPISTSRDNYHRKVLSARPNRYW